jgi:hypothetical protein
MGGYGAMMLALRHPDLYGAVASHSGPIALLYVGPHPFDPAKEVTLAQSPTQWGSGFTAPMQKHIREIFGPDMGYWRDHDPVTLLQKLDPAQAPANRPPIRDPGWASPLRLLEGPLALEPCLLLEGTRSLAGATRGARHGAAVWIL